MAIAWKYTPPRVSGLIAMAALTELAAVAAADVVLEASRPLVPVDKDVLRPSGEVERGDGEATISYSAVAKDGYNYAVIQHEDRDFHHDQGQANYLGQPMHDHAVKATALKAAGAVIRRGLA